jgi:sugar (pentulose or hexulose) kinase
VSSEAFPVKVFLGIDIGTSGIRGSCIDDKTDEICRHHIALDSQPSDGDTNEQDPNRWLPLLDELLTTISTLLEQHAPGQRICAIAIDGTSSTLIACDEEGTALSPALMYNDQQSRSQAETISRLAPAESAVHGASSSLAKALNLLARYPETHHLCHQADWLVGELSGRYDISDENNCLKLGYDSRSRSWPSWLFENNEAAVIPKRMLPEVVAPGTPIAKVKTDLVDKYRLADDCLVVAGTTDSNAAVLATGAGEPGDAVTSLGSTLVVKIFSERPIFDPEFGIYSHRIKGRWLAGGASNSGGAVLLKHFSKAQLDQMTPQLDPDHLIGLDYYPLPDKGERFPVNDSNKTSKIEPRPDSDIQFFQALLEGIASIEKDAYEKLHELGATRPGRIYTAGGGSKNPAWTAIRSQIIGTDILQAPHSEACYGSALLARSGYLAARPA